MHAAAGSPFAARISADSSALDWIPADVSVLVIASDGSFSELPGRPAGEQLADGSSLRAAIARQWRSLPPCWRFLWIAPVHGSWHRVSVLRHRADSALVTERRMDPFRGLTRREVDVLHLVADGKTNAEIAQLLWVSTSTVSKHVEHLLQKLGTRSRVGLASTAIREGLHLLESPGLPHYSVTEQPLGLPRPDLDT
ncbi:response regulator transcription factor [Arthrobacter bambusae]|nr:helix-turn-helix transcriptional regulator [Arthrobacter bambusae]